MLRLAAIALGVLTCQPRGEALRTALLEDNRFFLARDPEAVARKLERMARDPYSYFRGSAGVYAEEIPRARGPAVALVGDPHPENVGAFPSADGSWRLEWNDFDRARFGPFVDDVRRLGVGLYVCAETAKLGARRRRLVVHKMARGYADEIAALAAGADPVSIRPGAGFGKIVEDLFAEARSRNDEARGPVPADARLPEGDEALVRGVLEAWPGSLPIGERPSGLSLRAARRDPVGVGSRANLRFVAIVDGGAAVEIKEIRGSAAGAVRLQRAFHERPDDDPGLGWASHGGTSFLVRRIFAWRTRPDVDRIAARMRAGTWLYRDLRTFAHHLGRLLARGHARAPGPGGRAPLREIAAALVDRDGFLDGVVRFSDDRGRQTLDDFRIFRRLRRERGALLGWEPARTSRSPRRQADSAKR